MHHLKAVKMVNKRETAVRQKTSSFSHNGIKLCPFQSICIVFVLFTDDTPMHSFINATPTSNAFRQACQEFVQKSRSDQISECCKIAATAKICCEPHTGAR